MAEIFILDESIVMEAYRRMYAQPRHGQSFKRGISGRRAIERVWERMGRWRV